MTRVLRWCEVVALCLLPGCHSTVVRSGLPPGEVPESAREQQTESLGLGILQGDMPTDLISHCPQGWSEIRTETTFTNGLLQVLTLGVYTPQTFSIVCAAASDPVLTAPPLGGLDGQVPPPVTYPPPARPPDPRKPDAPRLPGFDPE